MLRLKLKERIADLEFRLDRRVTVGEIAEATGINRMTLSKMLNHRGHNTRSENLDKLCRFFNCRIEDLVEYVPDEEVETFPAETKEGSENQREEEKE